MYSFCIYEKTIQQDNVKDLFNNTNIEAILFILRKINLHAEKQYQNFKLAQL